MVEGIQRDIVRRYILYNAENKHTINDPLCFCAASCDDDGNFTIFITLIYHEYYSIGRDTYIVSYMCCVGWAHLNFG